MNASGSSTIKRFATIVAAAAFLALPASAALAAGEPKPHFGTGGVSHVSGTSAQLEGSVNTEGLATTYFFEYGPTVTYGLKSKKSPCRSRLP